MHIRSVKKLLIAVVIIIALLCSQQSGWVFADVKPITEVQDKLEGISDEEKAVLENLFTLAQEVTGMEQEIKKIGEELEVIGEQQKELEKSIAASRKDYEVQLDLLRQVLVHYQRGGPATYLEILLNADNFTTFLKRINVLKDISKNVGELLNQIEIQKKSLEEQQEVLKEKEARSEEKQEELRSSLDKKQQLKEKQEEYLNSLKDQKSHYEEQLDNIEQMWDHSKGLFHNILLEIGQVIGNGFFTMGDLNLKFQIPLMKGAIEENNFNRILHEHSNLKNVKFHFTKDGVSIEVPDYQLHLAGKFVISGKTGIRYDVREGSFYDMPLEESSLNELFEKGALEIDFKAMAGDLILDFNLEKIENKEGFLAFEIKPEL